MGKGQQADHGAAGGARITGGKQVLPGGAVGGAREQRVTIDQVEQRHRLAAQAVDDVAGVPPPGGAPPARGAGARRGGGRGLLGGGIPPGGGGVGGGPGGGQGA